MRRILAPISALLAAALVVGVLLALLVAPFVGAAGIGARTASDAFLALPSHLPEARVPERSRILAADGSLLAMVYLQNRQPVPLDAVSVEARKAILAVEDSRFYDHNGIDPKGLVRAAANNSQGGDLQGASTLTQQYVKNALLLLANTEEGQKAATEQSVARKLREARYALQVEEDLTKDEILERYLNIAYFGDGAYGIEAAARHFYSKPAKDLVVGEAALLAGLVQNPSRFDPTDYPEDALKRRNLVLMRMNAVGDLDDVQYAAEREKPLELKVSPVRNGCETSFAAFYCDWVRSELEQNPALGATREERLARLLEGGLTVKTTIDPAMQQAAQGAVDSVLGRENRVAAASVVVEPGTGHVKAMAVNRTFGKDPGETEFPLATAPAYQPGSTFKLFTLVAALEKGLPLSTTLAGGDCHRSRVFKNPPRGCFTNAADGEGGAMTMSQATWLSVNTWYVQLEERVGVIPVAETARKMGVVSIPLDGPNPVTPDEGSLTLGAREVSPLEMAGAYATVAAHGKWCKPLAATQIKDAAGNVLLDAKPECKQAIAPEVADTAASVLEGVLTEGTGKRAQIGRPAAGKTGTTSSYGAAWFVGFTPQLATAVWIGDPRGPSFALRGVRTYEGTDPRMFGGDAPAEVWKRTMVPAHASLPVKGFVGPDANVAAPASLRVPSVLGLPAKQAEAILAAAGYSVKVEASQPRPFTAPGTVVSTSPSPGTPVDDPGLVTIVTAG